MKVVKVRGLNTALLKLNFGEHSIRFWSLTYLFLYFSFGFIDFLSAPISFKTFWLIRLCVLPCFLLALLSTYLEEMKSYRPLINAVMVFVAPMSIMLMIAKSDPVEWSMYTYFAGIVLATFPIGFILMNTRYTVAILVLLAVSYFLIIGVGLNFYSGDYYFFVMTTFFVVSALIASFLSTHLLEGNQTKILKQKNELEELVEIKNRLINILAHDLRAPCNSIVGFSDLFISQADNYKMEDAKNFMEHINMSANNLLSLLQNLLEWSRIQTNTHALSPTAIEVNQLIDTSVEMMKGAMALKNIGLRVNVAMENVEVVADQQMISTVLRNLLSNAIKFSYGGGEINVQSWNSNGMAYIAIGDCGVGIGQNRINNLFEIANSKSTKGTSNETGSGLGLVLCREFVAINEGEIWVSSEEGKGSTFTFSLPLKEAV